MIQPRSCQLWSETLGLRTRPVWDQRNRYWYWSCRFCVVLWNTLLSQLVVTMSMEDTAAAQVLVIVSIFCAWNITTVAINS